MPSKCPRGSRRDKKSSECVLTPKKPQKKSRKTKVKTTKPRKPKTTVSDFPSVSPIVDIKPTTPLPSFTPITTNTKPETPLPSFTPPHRGFFNRTLGRKNRAQVSYLKAQAQLQSTFYALNTTIHPKRAIMPKFPPESENVIERFALRAEHFFDTKGPRGIQKLLDRVPPAASLDFSGGYWSVIDFLVFQIMHLAIEMVRDAQQHRGFFGSEVVTFWKGLHVPVGYIHKAIKQLPVADYLNTHYR